MLHEDIVEVLQVCDELEKATLSIFPGMDGPKDAKVLWHNDLFMFNILVDPVTYQITGLLDWESVSIVPACDIQDGIPRFLQGIEVTEPPPHGSLSAAEEASLSEIRKDLELVLLRRKCTEIVGPLYDSSSVAENTLQRKRDLFDCLATFEDRWEKTQYWLKGSFDSAGQ